MSRHKYLAEIKETRAVRFIVEAEDTTEAKATAEDVFTNDDDLQDRILKDEALLKSETSIVRRLSAPADGIVATRTQAESDHANGYFFLVTVDSTSQGEYENAAHAVPFATMEEAETYVKSDIADTVVNSGLDGKDADKFVKRYGDNTYQFRYREAIVDWKIEKWKIPA